MIKVLMIGNHPSNKGGMTSVINQIKDYNWAEEDVDLSFIPTFLPGNAVKKAFYFALSYFCILFKFVFSKPDIVHMHMSYKGSFTRKYYIHKMCKLFKIKDVIHLHGSEFSKWYNQVDERKKNKIRRLLSECDKFVVLGKEWKETVLEIEPQTNVTVISNGITIPNEKVHWNDEYIQLLFLGVLIPRKGVSDLIKAIEKLKKEELLNKVRLVIAGTGEEEAKLKQQVFDAKLGEYITFAGWISGDKKTDLLLNSQIFVLPSYNEGLPISILEAASYGMPVISTDVGDISSVVKNEVNGYLVKPGDIEALHGAILEMADKETFTRMSGESRRVIEESFSLSLFYEKLLSVYRELGRANGKI